MNLYLLGVCLKCRGDLAYDEGDWICLQCGVYYYTGLYPETQWGEPRDGKLRVSRRGCEDHGDAADRLAQAAD